LNVIIHILMKVVFISTIPIEENNWNCYEFALKECLFIIIRYLHFNFCLMRSK
jgi:hypothetical protein